MKAPKNNEKDSWKQNKLRSRLKKLALAGGTTATLIAALQGSGSEKDIHPVDLSAESSHKVEWLANQFGKLQNFSNGTWVTTPQPAWDSPNDQNGGFEQKTVSITRLPSWAWEYELIVNFHEENFLKEDGKEYINENNDEKIIVHLPSDGTIESTCNAEKTAEILADVQNMINNISTEN